MTGRKLPSVQVCHDGDQALVRNPKDPDGPILSFDQSAWDAFIAAVKAGELDWTTDVNGDDQ